MATVAADFQWTNLVFLECRRIFSQSRSQIDERGLKEATALAASMVKEQRSGCGHALPGPTVVCNYTRPTAKSCMLCLSAAESGRLVMLLFCLLYRRLDL